VPGRIQHIDFLKHRVQLEPLEEGEHGRAQETADFAAPLDRA
jgi:hypothetical protein